MVKYFLVLTLCSVAMFLVVLRVRPGLVNIDFSPWKEPERAEPPKPSEKKNGVERSPANRPRRAEAGSYPSTDKPESNSPKVEVPPSPATPRVVQTTVANDSVAVYATNSVNSRILKMLKKGDQVETNLGVVDSQGTWSLIRVPDQRISGYVLSENLERKRPSKPENQ